MVTIKEIADKANISVATVSRVMNTPEVVAEETREKVLTLIRKNNYRQNIIARSLVKGKSDTLAIVTPSDEEFFRAHYFQSLFMGINEQAGSSSYNILNFMKSNESMMKNNFPVDGYIIVAPAMDSRLVENMSLSSIPCVLLNRSSEKFSCINLDNFSAAREATEYLVGLGHRNIGVLAGGINIQNSEERLAGYKKALQKNGLFFRAGLVESGGFSIEGGLSGALRLLNRKDRPSALFAFNDLMAIGAIRAARSIGLSVPEDLSVVGFDDMDISSDYIPAITTVRQPFYEMGKSATEMLIGTIERGVDEPRERIFSGELIVRESCSKYSDRRIL